MTGPSTESARAHTGHASADATSESTLRHLAELDDGKLHERCDDRDERCQPTGPGDKGAQHDRARRDPADDDERGGGYQSSSKRQEKSRTPVLDNFGRDFTKLAEEGKLDPIIGREREIERVSQILSRGACNAAYIWYDRSDNPKAVTIGKIAKTFVIGNNQPPSNGNLLNLLSYPIVQFF